MDWGKFRDGKNSSRKSYKITIGTIYLHGESALDYGHHQLGISEELDNPQMRSEAYLNLARAHERLGKKYYHFPTSSSNPKYCWSTDNRMSGALADVRTPLIIQRM